MKTTMKDITTYCAKSDIKPVLTKVYVHTKNDEKFAVATDAFRLIEWKITDDFLIEYIHDGFYDAKKWKEMCKAYNKKSKDLVTFANTIKENAVVNENFKEDFPNYEQLIPGKTKSFDGTMVFNLQYLKEFLDLIPLNKFQSVDFLFIKQTDRMIIYKDDNIVNILMAQNR